MRFLTLLGLFSCSPDEKTPPPSSTAQTVHSDCDSEALSALLAEELQLSEFALIELDTAAFQEAALTGAPVAFPVIDQGGTAGTVDVDLYSLDMRSDEATALSLKSRDGSAEEVPLGAPASWRMGCEPGESCGALTLLGDTGYEAMLMDDALGWVVLESASSLLTNLDRRDLDVSAQCGVLYNATAHPDIAFEEPVLKEPEGEAPLEALSMVSANIPIVLDGDATFYSLDPATTADRQYSLLAQVNLIYGLIEPQTSGLFNIVFEIHGQEVWTQGGPDTSIAMLLISEINDSSYPMIHHPDSDEVSYFFVGYDLSGGVAGVAGGICDYPGSDNTYGSPRAIHQRNHAFGQQVPDVDGGYAFSTFYGRTVVAAHELGHMLGARHEDGDPSTCAGGSLPGMCGCTLMRSGASGGVAPDERQPFFTDINASRIATCVDNAN